MKPEQLKQAAAEAALAYVKHNTIIGIGTGSTVNYFINALAAIKHKLEGTIASSNASAEKLKSLGIPVLDLNSVSEVDLYVDGADEFNQFHYLTKGGGGALTREKIVASAAKNFVCIVDASKEVTLLGQKHPIPIEVIPMARSYVARQIVKMGADPVYRENFVTDNGNVILDVYNLKILDPIQWEQRFNNLTGIVENGIFAQRKADIILCSCLDGIKTL